MGLSKRVFIIMENSLCLFRNPVIYFPAQAPSSLKHKQSWPSLASTWSAAAQLGSQVEFILYVLCGTVLANPGVLQDEIHVCLFVCLFQVPCPSLSTKQYKHLHCHTQEYKKIKAQETAKGSGGFAFSLDVALFFTLFKLLQFCVSNLKKTHSGPEAQDI